MATSAHSRIDLSPVKRTVEKAASETIFPGYLLELSSTDKFQKNDIEALAVPRIVALQKQMEGQGILSSTSSGSYTYAVDETVVGGVFASGDEALLRVPAGADAIVIGDRLQATAGGRVIKLASASNTAIAIATEAVDNSGGGAEAYVAVRFI